MPRVILYCKNSNGQTTGQALAHWTLRIGPITEFIFSLLYITSHGYYFLIPGFRACTQKCKHTIPSIINWYFQNFCHWNRSRGPKLEKNFPRETNLSILAFLGQTTIYWLSNCILNSIFRSSSWKDRPKNINKKYFYTRKKYFFTKTLPTKIMKIFWFSKSRTI